MSVAELKEENEFKVLVVPKPTRESPNPHGMEVVEATFHQPVRYGFHRPSGKGGWNVFVYGCRVCGVDPHHGTFLRLSVDTQELDPALCDAEWLGTKEDQVLICESCFAKIAALWERAGRPGEAHYWEQVEAKQYAHTGRAVFEELTAILKNSINWHWENQYKVQRTYSILLDRWFDFFPSDGNDATDEYGQFVSKCWKWRYGSFGDQEPVLVSEETYRHPSAAVDGLLEQLKRELLGNTRLKVSIEEGPKHISFDDIRERRRERSAAG